jgi:hypothetical protein
MSRAGHHKFAREMKRYAERCGFENVSLAHLRRHPVIRGRVNGKAVTLVIPGTPSDWRSRRNTFADIRRAAREARP